MAVAIMGGLFVATVLTLLFLPALYAAWFRVKRPGSTVSVPVTSASASGASSSAPVMPEVPLVAPVA